MEGNRGVEGGICLVVAGWIWCGLEAATDRALGESGPIVVPWATSCWTEESSLVCVVSPLFCNGAPQTECIF
jgi:hypothetical protein